jgi:cytochrome c peroxidase
MRRVFTAAGTTAPVTLVLLYFAAVGTGQDFGGRSIRLDAFAALPRVPQHPPDNPSTPAKVNLGRLLFWDPILSGPKDVACATCHHPRFGYAEDRDISIGVNGVGLGGRRQFNEPNAIPFVKRNSQTILNASFNGMDDAGNYSPADAPMFWDVRKRSLETQALEPLKALEEMRGHSYAENEAVPAVVARLNTIREYRELFAKAFGGAEVTTEVLAKALATFQRSLTANNSPFDRYMRGDTNAMSASQLRGLRRFERIGCINCHRGPMFSDFKMHVLGVPDNPRLPVSDTGAPEAEQGEQREPYAFRTASLRNLRFTAPYMHSGVFRSLEDVLEFYDDVTDRRGGDRNPHVSREQLDPLLRRLRGVDDDDDDLIGFLEALSDDSFDRTIPSRVPSGLSPGGSIQ